MERTSFDELVASGFTRVGMVWRSAPLLAAALLLMPAPAALAQQQHSLPLFSPVGSAQQGFLRIINRSDRAGTVRIHGVDDSGERFGPATLSLGAMATGHLSSMDLEDGNAGKGLSGSIGDGEGDWRLELTTDLDIEPLAYIRTSDGFVTSVHDVVQPEVVPADSNPGGAVSPILYHVRFFNPGKNANQVSRLRLSNASDTETVVTISGLDDAGASPPGGDVSVTLPAYAARTITARQLEDGDAGFRGSFGKGTGKWQLFIAAKGTLYDYTRPIQVVSLLYSRNTGNLANLSGIGSGNDPNRGGDGVDFITGGSGDDVLNPGDNDDLFDVVYGSAGNDRIIFSDSGTDAYQWLGYSGLSGGINATINGITNRATVDKGALGTDTIVDIANPLDAGWNNGGLGVGGTPFDDTFTLTLEDEGQSMEVEGHAGNDRFDIRSGSVRLIYYSDSKQGIDVDLAAGRVNDDGYGDVDTIVGYVWGVTGGAGNDTIRGTDGIDRLGGGPGDDEINPRDNPNYDHVYASTGNDRIIYTENENGWQGLFYSRSWAGPTALDESGVTVTLDGAANRATIDKGSNGTDTLVDVAKPLAAGWMYGGLAIYGTRGDDVFNLSLDHDQWMMARGEAGNDTFNLRSLRWESNELPGARIRVDYSSSPGGIVIDLRAGRAANDGFGDVDTFTFNDGDFEIQGSRYSDTILGSDGDDRFIGRGGDDVIDGRGGYDLVRFDRYGVGAVTVNLNEGTATGTWYGTAFSCTLRNIEYVRGSNSSAGDELVGSNGNDQLEGRGGDDTINGYGGDDHLYGGDGNDTFVFDRGDGNDHIYDFADGEDILVLMDLGITSKDDVLRNAYAWDQGTGVHIDLTGFGGGRIDLHGLHRDQFDASDFLL